MFGKTPRTTRREAGILPSQEIEGLIRNGKIRSPVEISDDQIQPASLDLRLAEKAHRVVASFLPSDDSLIGPKIRDLQLEEIDLNQPTVLQPGSVYIARVVEFLDLPPDMGGKANPKSTTGRLDLFTRLLTEHQPTFEVVPNGYSGELYVEIFPRTFPVVVKTGTKLNQLRFFRGDTQSSDEQLRKLAQKRPIVFENGGSPNKPVIRQGLRVSLDLSSNDEVVAYKAKKTNIPIDLSKLAAYSVAEFWEPLSAQALKGKLVLKPDEFYLLASKEKIGVPPDCAAEMESYDPSIGEFTVHYAGFFDPGFGFGDNGEVKGTNAVLEVRAHELPILLEDGREVGRLIYYKMAERPDKIYGAGIGSSYQQQRLALPKQFKIPAIANPSLLASTHI
ncbi:MAG: 2'-deoxycytidine 5'-triphosphate deaminase [Acidobacteriia bacterium]|nr:2'-deoxycytidine 5'-triphosphate deaminase [Terriglobia bacterium]